MCTEKVQGKERFIETDEDLTKLYHSELKHLGYIALNGLREDEMCFDHSAFRDCTSNFIPELGFLSVQPGSSKRKPSLCYGFLHKSFQEFFAAFYLSCQLVDEEISPDGLVADNRYFNEFQQVLMFTCGILAQRFETKAKALMASIARQINHSIEERRCSDYLCVALICITECEKDHDTSSKELTHTLGSLLEIPRFICLRSLGENSVAVLAHALETNSTLGFGQR